MHDDATGERRGVDQVQVPWLERLVEQGLSVVEDQEAVLVDQVGRGQGASQPAATPTGREQTFALLHWFHRLRIRWEVRDDIDQALLKLGCALICRRRLRTSKG